MVRQYEKLMAMEEVKLTFAPSALKELARLAIRKKTGTRGLRAILERVMLDIMYEAPMKKQVKECHITKAVIDGHVPAGDRNGAALESKDKDKKSARNALSGKEPGKSASAERVA